MPHPKIESIFYGVRGKKEENNEKPTDIITI